MVEDNFEELWNAYRKAANGLQITFSLYIFCITNPFRISVKSCKKKKKKKEWAVSCQVQGTLRNMNSGASLPWIPCWSNENCWSNIRVTSSLCFSKHWKTNSTKHSFLTEPKRYLDLSNVWSSSAFCSTSFSARFATPVFCLFQILGFWGVQFCNNK